MYANAVILAYTLPLNALSIALPCCAGRAVPCRAVPCRAGRAHHPPGARHLYSTLRLTPCELSSPPQA